MNIQFLLIALFFITLHTSQAFAFNTPEKLEFVLKWIGIPAGTGLLSIEKEEGSYIIKSRAMSAKFISVFYEVDDRVQCIVDSRNGNFGYSLNYRLKISEGRHRRDKEVIFDHSSKKAVYIDHLNNTKKEFPLSVNTYDPLSGFYSVRQYDLKVGNTEKVTIFDSKKLWNVDVEVLKKERIEVSAGIFDTIVIKPKLKSEGIFKRKGDIYIWLTDDEKKVPVKLKTKAPIGHITAELTGGQY